MNKKERDKTSERKLIGEKKMNREKWKGKGGIMCKIISTRRSEEKKTKEIERERRDSVQN